MTALCAHCGAAVPEDAGFCTACGAATAPGDTDIVLPALPPPPSSPSMVGDSPATSPPSAPPQPGGPGHGRGLLGSGRRRALVVGATVVAVALVVAVGVGFAHRDRTPVLAGGTQRPPVGAAGTTDGSPSATPTTTGNTLTIDPDKQPTVTDPTSFTDGIALDLTCPSAGSAVATDEGADVQLDQRLGVRGAYVALRHGDQIVLVDRVEQRVAWCATLDVGSLTSPPEIGSQSPVGLPGYVPALDRDTLDAAFPAGDGPVLAVSDSRLWVLQPVQIARPTIGSQQARSFHAFIAFDDTGKATWLSSFAAVDDVDSGAVRFRRDSTNGALYRVSSSPTSSDLTIAPIDVTTGVVGKPWVAKGAGSDSSGGALVAGDYVASIERDADSTTTYGVSGWRGTDGKPMFSTPFAAGSASFAFTPQHVLVTRRDAQTGAATPLTTVYRLDSGSKVSLRAPFPLDLGDSPCFWNGAEVLVCGGQTTSDVAAIAALDLATGAVRWWWKTGDPDPVTKVARTVPTQFDTWGRYVYAKNPDDALYLMDLNTGADLSTPTSVVSFDDPFGEVSVSGDSLTLTAPQGS